MSYQSAGENENFSLLQGKEALSMESKKKPSTYKMLAVGSALVSAAIVTAVLVSGHSSSASTSLSADKSPVVKPIATAKISQSGQSNQHSSTKKDEPEPEPEPQSQSSQSNEHSSTKKDEPEPEPEPQSQSSQSNKHSSTKRDEPEHEQIQSLRGNTKATLKSEPEPDFPIDDEPVVVQHADLELLKQKKHTIYSTMPHEDHVRMFDSFKMKFKRNYSTSLEEKRRLDQFKRNMALIDVRNAEELRAGGSATHGITKFSDLSRAEIKKRYTNYKKNSDMSMSRFKKVDKNVYHVKKETTFVDWTGIYANEVRDQGYCGSCWAFSATEQIESDAIRAGYLSLGTLLSEQQIVSCDPYDLGCDGGNTETAYYYVYISGGLTTDENYPYTSYWDVTGDCTYTGGAGVVTVDGYYNIYGESKMKSFVLSTGPLSICLDASTWATYTGGVVSSCGKDIDHCVQAVGINSDKGYWKVRNSWGTDWGDAGYIYLKYGSDVCGLTYDPTYTDVVQVTNYYGPKSNSRKSSKKQKSMAAVASGM